MTLALDPVLRNYLSDSLAILKQSLAWSGQGARPAYRVAATQLRLLLCDTTRVHGRILDVSLAPRLFPDLSLHPLNLNANGEVQIDRGAERLPRLAWLTRPVAGGEAWTPRDAIRWVCDRDGGVHVDPQPRAAPLPDLERWIVSIGAYIYEELSHLVEST
ncbi:MAG TPA: hypothetical protein VMT46_17315 [Anaerolineaceae bacterium]|nr:hypothetical protein [Anaerolineaceae bacterium]